MSKEKEKKKIQTAAENTTPEQVKDPVGKLPNAIDRIEAKTAEEAEKEKKQKKHRLIIVTVILAAIFVAVVAILLTRIFSDDGWRDVTVSPSAGMNCSQSFTFRMKLDRSKVGNDFRMMSQAYTEATVREYKVYDIYEEHFDVHGMYELNHSVGKKIEIEPELYAAIEKLEKSGFRGLYLGPIYEVYQELFLTEDPYAAKQFDPYYDRETAEYFKEVAAFASDPSAISVKLLGNNEVELFVSEAYQQYASEWGITSYLDFFWMKNAFILDYIREAVVATGYTKGYLISEEGYAACLDTTEEVYEMLLMDHADKNVYSAAALQYTGPINIVSFHDYSLEDTYSDYYYVYGDNEYVTAYIDPADGFYKSAIPDMTLYSRTEGAADLLLAGADLVIAKKFDEGKAGTWAEKGCYPVYALNGVVVLYGDGMKASSVGEGYRLLEK